MTYDSGISPRARSGLTAQLRAWWGPNSLFQAAVIAAFVIALLYLGHNVLESMRARGMEPNFGYLWQRASFDIDERLISFSADDTFGRALLVGLLNTLKLAVCGCVLATLAGVTLGIIRLLGNPLLAGLVQAYVELIRNVPLALQLFFWIAIAHALPHVRQAIELLPSTYLSQRGVFLPWPLVENEGDLALTLGLLVVAGIAVIIFLRRRQRPLPTLGLVGLIALVPAVAATWIWLTGTTVTLDMPVLGKFNINGGLNLSPEFAAMLTGLTVYYAASISESVRSGIQAVGGGQWEAGTALGLSRGRIMRLIVFPQALRVITPLMTSSFLDLTKDTSLGPLIGFYEVTQVIKESANKDGNAVATLVVLVIIFLAISLPVSFLINLYNRRLIRRGIVAR